MSTYIQGITDYIPEIQQYQPDFNFFNTILEKRQSLYDEAREKIADVYNTVLNSPMLREADLNKREEFFKQIDEDIKKISRTDLSLRQNQQQAAHVFSQFLDDKSIAHDMVYTKKASDALKYGDYLRESGDKGYWAGMSQNIQYDMMQYKNADDQTALSMQAPKYIKRVDIMGDVMDKMKDMKFDVTEESPYVKIYDKNGNVIGQKESQWIIKRKNGTLIEPYLQSMFFAEYANRGDVAAYYKELAKNTRLNWANQNASMYGSFEAANQEYIKTAAETSKQEMAELVSVVNDETENKKTQIASTKSAIESAESKEDNLSVEYYNKKLSEYVDELAKMQTTSEVVTTQNNLAENATYSPDMVDGLVASNLLRYDILNAAKTASMIGAEVSYKENPYEKMRIQHSYDMAKLEREYQLKKDLEDYKHQKENEAAPYETINIGIVDGGTEEYDPDERGSHVISEYEKIYNSVGNSGLKAAVMNDAFPELRSVAEDKSNWESYVARRILAGIMLDYVSEEEKLAVTKKCGGAWDKIYEELKSTSIDFNNANPTFIINSYEKIKNNLGLVNKTRAKHQMELSHIATDDKAMNEAFGGVKNDLSAAIETMDDVAEKAIVRAMFGLKPGDKYQDWDGSVSGFAEYFSTAKQYIDRQNGLTESMIRDYWENGKAKRLAGEKKDMISQKTKYAIMRSQGNPGMDSKCANSTSFFVSNKLDDACRGDIYRMLTIGANLNNSIAFAGMVPSKKGENDESLKSILRDYAINLNNTYDGKSKAAYAYEVNTHPIAMGNSEMYAISIKRPDAKDDDPDKNGITLVIPKDQLRGRGIYQFESVDKTPYEDLMFWANGPVPIPEARNTSLYFDVKNGGNGGKDLMIGTDANGQLYVLGQCYAYDPVQKKGRFIDWSQQPISEFNTADAAVNFIVNSIAMGQEYAKLYGYK